MKVTNEKREEKKKIKMMIRILKQREGGEIKRRMKQKRNRTTGNNINTK